MIALIRLLRRIRPRAKVSLTVFGPGDRRAVTLTMEYHHEPQ